MTNLAHLRRVLIDRASIVTRRPEVEGTPTPTVKRVGGKTILRDPVAPPEGEDPDDYDVVQTFRCRLNVADATPEQRTPFQGARQRTMRGPTLTYWRTDEAGEPVELGPEDVLLVTANNVNGGEPQEWQVNGKPLVIRGRSRLLGAGLVQVSRVGEAEDPDE